MFILGEFIVCLSWENRWYVYPGRIDGMFILGELMVCLSWEN